MNDTPIGIGELADAAGSSRRAVRFYVMRKLLPPPLGRGRGGHYTAAHLQQLRKIQELQQAGHSLDAIGQILMGAAPLAIQSKPLRRVARVFRGIDASLWTHVHLGEGVILQFDATRYRLTADQLLALREAVQATLSGDEMPGSGPVSSNPTNHLPEGGQP